MKLSNQVVAAVLAKLNPIPMPPEQSLEGNDWYYLRPESVDALAGFAESHNIEAKYFCRQVLWIPAAGYEPGSHTAYVTYRELSGVLRSFACWVDRLA